MTKKSASIETCFADLDDPRVSGRCDHKLIDIIIIAICAVICDADDWVGVETFGQVKEARLRQVLELPNGIPHTTRLDEHLPHWTRKRFKPVLRGGLRRCFMSPKAK